VPGEVVGSSEEDCGIGVCCLFAKDVWGCRRLKIQGWSSSLFAKQDEVVVLVMDRLGGGPVSGMAEWCVSRGFRYGRGWE